MRIGFVGCGRHATTSIYPALRPAGLELTAVCARSLDHARATAETWGAEPFDDVDTMLASGALDALLVAVPPDAYRDVVLAGLAAGLPVFTEKPGGSSSEDLGAIEAASADAGLPVMVGYMKRFAPAYRHTLERTRAAEFGPVTSLHAKFVMGPGFGSLHGYVIDNPVHALDLLRLFGGEVERLEAGVRTVDEQRHAVSVLLHFESGAVGTAQLGTTASFFQENESLEVFGVEHGVEVRNVDTVTYRPPAGPVEQLRPTYTVPLPPNSTATSMGFVPELQHFAAVVGEGVPCESDVASARRTLKLAERLWRAIEPAR